MKTIYKYPVNHIEDSCIVMPKGAKILSFHSQNDVPCIWALVDPEKPPEERNFYLIGTGHVIEVDPAKLRFIDTALFSEGEFVHHLFEITGAKAERR